MSSTSLNKILGKRPFLRPTPSTEWPLAAQMVGIEMEIEGIGRNNLASLLDRIQGTWEQHRDDSLRGGTELVLAEPLMGKELSEAISTFFKGGLEFPTGSSRASTHVHLNMLQEEDTIEVLRNLASFYYAIEDALYACISESRKWAVYASPLSNNFPYEIAMLFSEQLDSDTWIRQLANTRKSENNNGRHYGFNMKAMAKYGTVEFRHFPQVTSEKELRDWINLAMEIKSVAVNLDAAGATTKSYFDTPEKFDELPKLMPIWGQRLLDLLDREDAVQRVDALYELLPVMPRNVGNYETFMEHKLFKEESRVGVKKPAKVQEGYTPNDIDALLIEPVAAPRLRGARLADARTAQRTMDEQRQAARLAQLHQLHQQQLAMQDVVTTRAATAGDHFDMWLVQQNAQLANRTNR